jgi:hypothetical protein
VAEACAAHHGSRGLRSRRSTDDHPFPYLRQAGLPPFYLLTIGLILVASLVLVRGVAGSLRPMRSYLDLAAMGAAFLLLETKNVVQFALLFGTTWFVNALVFAASCCLCSLRSRSPAPPGPAAECPLSGPARGLAIAWLLPAAVLLRLDFWPRLLAAATVAFLPIFLANLVFAGRFPRRRRLDQRLRCESARAMVWRLVEYLALVTGYQALLVAWRRCTGSPGGLARRSGALIRLVTRGAVAAPTSRKLISYGRRRGRDGDHRQRSGHHRIATGGTEGQDRYPERHREEQETASRRPGSGCLPPVAWSIRTGRRGTRAPPGRW